MTKLGKHKDNFIVINKYKAVYKIKTITYKSQTNVQVAGVNSSYTRWNTVTPIFHNSVVCPYTIEKWPGPSCLFHVRRFIYDAWEIVCLSGYLAALR